MAPVPSVFALFLILVTDGKRRAIARAKFRHYQRASRNLSISFSLAYTRARARARRRPTPFRLIKRERARKSKVNHARRVENATINTARARIPRARVTVTRIRRSRRVVVFHRSGKRIPDARAREVETFLPRDKRRRGWMDRFVRREKNYTPDNITPPRVSASFHASAGRVFRPGKQHGSPLKRNLAALWPCIMRGGKPPRSRTRARVNVDERAFARASTRRSSWRWYSAAWKDCTRNRLMFKPRREDAGAESRLMPDIVRPRIDFPTRRARPGNYARDRNTFDKFH